jgi:DNA-binding NarL/FixJ family response regulator
MTPPDRASDQNSGNNRVSVVIVDDHTLFRDAIKALLKSDEVCTVVGEGANGAEAVSLAAQFRPDVMLLDVEMPGPGLTRTLSQVRKASPFTQVIVLTMHESANIVRAALDHGASGFLIKTITREELIAAVRSASSSSDQVLLAVSRQTSARLHGSAAREPGLSPRELEVLRMLAQAHSNAQIAAELFIAEGTVKRHLTSVYAKLNAVSRLDALRKASAAGLIEGLRFGTDEDVDPRR